MGNDIFPLFPSFLSHRHICVFQVRFQQSASVRHTAPTGGALDLDDAAVAPDVQRVVDIQRVEQFVDLPAAGERGEILLAEQRRVADDDLHVEHTFQIAGDLIERLVTEDVEAVAPRDVVRTVEPLADDRVRGVVDQNLVAGRIRMVAPPSRFNPSATLPSTSDVSTYLSSLYERRLKRVPNTRILTLRVSTRKGRSGSLVTSM